MAILIFILVLFALVLVHELGHFFVAKKTGMRVDEFGIGFPPRLVSVKKGETEYSINALPLGGFVKIFGEDGTNEYADAGAQSAPASEQTNDHYRSFSGKPKWMQALVLLAGITANILFAWFLFTLAFLNESFPIHRAVIEGLKLTAIGLHDITFGIISLLASALVFKANLTGVAGPIGIVGLVGDASALGLSALLLFTAFISLNLAVINILPFPALDGGRLLFVLIEAVKGSPIPAKVAYYTNTTGFAILIILMIAITYNDIARLM